MKKPGGFQITDWRVFDVHYRARVTYGFEKLGLQDPYFSITGETQEKASNGRWYDSSSGHIAQTISQVFPELEPLLKWHLCSLNDGPMHYVANGLYWFEKHAGRSPWKQESYEPDPLEAFKSTIVFGALKSDEMPAKTCSNQEVADWLKGRLKKLMVQFRKTMKQFDIKAAK